MSKLDTGPFSPDRGRESSMPCRFKMWTVSGLSVDCQWTVSGLSVDCQWTVSGLSVD